LFREDEQTDGLSGSQTASQTDIQNENNSRFMQYCKPTKKVSFPGVLTAGY